MAVKQNIRMPKTPAVKKKKVRPTTGLHGQPFVLTKGQFSAKLKEELAKRGIRGKLPRRK